MTPKTTATFFKTHTIYKYMNTPETDAESCYPDSNLGECVCADFARKLERERDEAREEIKEWKTLCLWGGTPEHIHGFIRGQQSRIQHLERERDEAFELLASEKTTRNHIIKRSVEVERERDEAREALMKIEDLFLECTDIYTDRENMGLIARSALGESK